MTAAVIRDSTPDFGALKATFEVRKKKLIWKCSKSAGKSCGFLLKKFMNKIYPAVQK
jgi:hypothetical protein